MMPAKIFGEKHKEKKDTLGEGKRRILGGGKSPEVRESRMYTK